MRQRMEVGGYRLIKRLGSGGMSTVYEAEDAGGTRVALKLLHPALAENGGRERLAREVQMLLKVTGPHVSEVLDAETDGEDAFIVTELVDGPTLEQDVVDHGIYEGEDLATLGRELREAVASIHSVGVLHRDITPSNVMIGAEGPVLIDFGISQLRDDSRLTAPGSVTQTAGWCDPKVLAGGSPDEDADWWALAAVLAFAATGRPPFGHGQAPSILRRVMDGEADVAGLSEPLARAFAAALAPKRRIPIDTLLAVLDDPSCADDVLPAWAGPAMLAPATETIDMSTVVEEANGGDAQASGDASSRQEVTEVLAASERHDTEVLDGQSWAGEPYGGGISQGTEVLDPIFDEVPAQTMPYAQPPVAPDIAPPHVQAAAVNSGYAAEAYAPTLLPAEAAYVGMSAAAVTGAQAPVAQTAVMQPPGGQIVPSPVGTVQAGQVIGYDAAGNPIYADGVVAPVPNWARIAPPARWLVFLAGLTLAGAGGLWPTWTLAIFAVIHVLFGTSGRVVRELRERRLAKGGRYSHDVVGAIVRLPWAFVRALFSSLVCLLIGALAGGLVSWIGMTVWNIEVMAKVPSSFATVAALFVGMSVAWLLPLNRAGRDGARSIAHTLAPSGGYTAFWSLVLLAGVAVFAMLIYSGSGVSPKTLNNMSISEIWTWLRGFVSDRLPSSGSS